MYRKTILQAGALLWLVTALGLTGCESDPAGAAGNGLTVVDQNYSTAEDTQLNASLRPAVTRGFTNTTMFALAGGSGPNNGSVTVNSDGSFIYNPSTNYFGPDSFDFTVTNDGDTFTFGTANITVTPVNDAPVAQDASVTTQQNMAISGLLLATDGDGDPLTFALDSSTINGTVAVQASGNYTYQPNTNFVGNDRFTFIVTDGTGGSDTGTVTITVTGGGQPPAGNNAPVAQNQSFTLAPGASLTNEMLSVVDSDGDPLTLTLLNGPTMGTATLDTDMTSPYTFSYTPNANSSGMDSFTYQANDGLGGTTSATVTIDVGNSAPVIDNQSFDNNEDTPLDNQMISASDADGVVPNDPNGDTLVITVVPGSGPANGTLTAFNDNGNGTATFSYTPDRDFNGTDTFSVQVQDFRNGVARGGTDTAIISINTTCTPTPPATICDWNKLPFVDDSSLTAAREPAISIDGLFRPNIAFTEQNPSAVRGVYVYQFQGGWTKLNGSGENGSLNDGGDANRPDIAASLITPFTLATVWDEDDDANMVSDIFVETRSDAQGVWTDVSGRPNDASESARDPAITITTTTSPVVTWSRDSDSNGTGDDILLIQNSGILAIPNAWTVSSTLDATPANVANLSTVATDDFPGTGPAANGRANVAWNEVDGGVSQIRASQCNTLLTGVIDGCAALGGVINENPTVDAVTPDITIPNLAGAALIGGSPTNPRPVVAFIEGGQLFVKRYNINNDDWDVLPDSPGGSNALNISATGIAANPAITTDVLGRYTVVWSEREPSGSGQIYVKRFVAAAQGAGAWEQLGSILNCDSNQNATNPDIGVDLGGIPYITFEEEINDGNGGVDTRIVVLQYQD